VSEYQSSIHELTVLALATKGILSVTQPEPWGMIVLRFTVEA